MDQLHKQICKRRKDLFIYPKKSMLKVCLDLLVKIVLPRLCAYQKKLLPNAIHYLIQLNYKA